MDNVDGLNYNIMIIKDAIHLCHLSWIIQNSITNRERRTRGSHDFKFIVPKGHKDIFRLSFFPRTITEWNKLPQETVSSQFLCIFKSKLI